MTLQERQAEKELSLKNFNGAVFTIDTAQMKTSIIQDISAELK